MASAGRGATRRKSSNESESVPPRPGSRSRGDGLSMLFSRSVQGESTKSTGHTHVPMGQSEMLWLCFALLFCERKALAEGSLGLLGCWLGGLGMPSQSAGKSQNEKQGSLVRY
jgi:hypothetical protein